MGLLTLPGSLRGWVRISGTDQLRISGTDNGQSFDEEAYAKDLDALSAEQWRAESEGE
jgi:hypothetical protein